jgi:hypothetical protein
VLQLSGHARTRSRTQHLGHPGQDEVGQKRRLGVPQVLRGARPGRAGRRSSVGRGRWPRGRRSPPRGCSRPPRLPQHLGPRAAHRHIIPGGATRQFDHGHKSLAAQQVRVAGRRHGRSSDERWASRAVAPGQWLGPRAARIGEQPLEPAPQQVAGTLDVGRDTHRHLALTNILLGGNADLQLRRRTGLHPCAHDRGSQRLLRACVHTLTIPGLDSARITLASTPA